MWAFPNVYHGEVGNSCYKYFIEVEQFSHCKGSFKVVRVPTRTGKPGKMGRHFPVREKSGNFEQTGKVREKSGKITQNTGKYWNLR